MLPEANGVSLFHLQQSDFELEGLADFQSWLSPEELQRLQRLQLVRHKRQLLLGRILLREVLSRCLPRLAPEQWRFIYNEQGKPEIDPAISEDGLRFNLSHSRDSIVMAVSRNQDTGIDIEYNQRPRRVPRIVQRFFSALECGELAALPVSSQLERFYQLWTLKESYIKARGLGLALPLDSFSFQFPGSGQIRFSSHSQDSNAQQSDWGFWQLGWDRQYSCALARMCREGEAAVVLQGWQMTGPGEFRESSPIVLASNQS